MPKSKVRKVRLEINTPEEVVNQVARTDSKRRVGDSR